MSILNGKQVHSAVNTGFLTNGSVHLYVEYLICKLTAVFAMQKHLFLSYIWLRWAGKAVLSVSVSPWFGQVMTW